MSTCFHFIADYIKQHTKPLPEKISQRGIPIPADLTNSWREMSFINHKTLPSTTLTDEQYVRWSELLRNRFRWRECLPRGLCYALKEAHAAWISNLSKKMLESIERDLLVYQTSEVFSTIKIREITVPENTIVSNGDEVSRKCSFCEKETTVDEESWELSQTLIGSDKFHCTFCVSHGFYTKISKDVLILTLRAIPGFLYEVSYSGKSPTLYVSQIRDMINCHHQIGKRNPLFVYDEESYCWFIDFNKVGKSKKKISLESVVKTVIDMISAFNLFNYVTDFKSHKLVEKFVEAITDFYRQRYRPDGKKILCPTLIGTTGVNRSIPQKRHNVTTYKHKKIEFEEHRNFTPERLSLNSRRF